MPKIPAKRKVLASKSDAIWLRLFSVAFGTFIGLSLLKFGNPCLFEQLVPWPGNAFEWALSHWPLKIGYWLAGILIVISVFVARVRTCVPRWVLLMPLGWLGWQFVSATQSVDGALTRQVLPHFVICIACFYMGVFCLSQERSPFPFWIPILCAMLLIVAFGIQQRFGGLEETRRYFLAYIYPHMDSVPPEYLKKLSSDRIFSTLFYPNTLAGAILLLLPPTMVIFWQVSGLLTFPTRCCLLGVYTIAALGCLLWSGSKAGWLLGLLLLLVAALHLPFATRLKAILVGVLLLVGLFGFFWKYSTFFQHGATSVHARFDYWNAAIKTTAATPFFGSGPATFGVSYKAIKSPESEMARLAHNDYLEQASDSGVVGFVTFLSWMLSIAWFGYSRPDSSIGRFRFCVWLGILAWLLHGAVEFDLYIPAMAWTGYAVSGWLLAKPLWNGVGTERK